MTDHANKTETQRSVRLNYFSDLLCVWAYVAQIRVDELQHTFGAGLSVESHFFTLFGDTPTRIGEGWAERGGFDAFARHTEEVVAQFSHVELSNKVWRETRPVSSLLPHLYLKAMQMLGGGEALQEKVSWYLREAFFKHGRDIGRESVLEDIARELNLPTLEIKELCDSGQAYAALWSDQLLREKYSLEGSPSYVLNEGRQKLFGNVGYKILEANVAELVKSPVKGASWC